MTFRLPICFIILVILVILIILSPPLFANDLEFSAGKVTSIFAEGNNQTVLQGNAVVENEDIRVTANTIRLSGDDNRYISGEGAISLYDKESDVELGAEVFTYDSEEDILLLEGNSRFRSEEENILIYSSSIERQPNIVVFQLNVQIIRKDMLANAEHVRYFEDEKRLELSGFPLVHYKDDEYAASVIIVYTETDEIILEGEVRGQISSDESDEDEGGETSDQPQVENEP